MKEIMPEAAALVPKLVSGEADLVTSALVFVRKHLNMDMAFLAEFAGPNLLFRAVNGEALKDVIHEGATLDMAETYAPYLLSGALPELMGDTSAYPVAQRIDMTHDFPVRSHVAVPIYRHDGTIYGLFGCVCRNARPSLNDRDLEVTRTFAALASDQVNTQIAREKDTNEKRRKIEEVLVNGSFKIALQPIMRLTDKGTAGYEALCRFASEPYRPPNFWFDDAAEVGLQLDLEVHVIKVALDILKDLGAECYLAVNTSPTTLASGRVTPLVEQAGGERLVIEITEHDEIEDIDALMLEIDRLRELGARIAVDDAGTGYSGLQQIIRLRPDVIKLDMSLTKDVDKDVARRSLASAMVQFAQDTHASVVAEGIETEAEMRTLRQLGVEMGQGYHLGKPTPAETVLEQQKIA